MDTLKQILSIWLIGMSVIVGIFLIIALLTFLSQFKAFAYLGFFLIISILAFVLGLVIKESLTDPYE